MVVVAVGERFSFSGKVAERLKAHAWKA